MDKYFQGYDNERNTQPRTVGGRDEYFYRLSVDAGDPIFVYFSPRFYTIHDDGYTYETEAYVKMEISSREVICWFSTQKELYVFLTTNKIKDKLTNKEELVNIVDWVENFCRAFPRKGKAIMFMGRSDDKSHDWWSVNRLYGNTESFHIWPASTGYDQSNGGEYEIDAYVRFENNWNVKNSFKTEKDLHVLLNTNISDHASTTQQIWPAIMHLTTVLEALHNVSPPRGRNQDLLR